MRIIAGQYRGRRLAPVGQGDAAAHLRPTTDRVRESLFSLLAHRGAIDGARVLDLFAGTGALGFESLSRGAAEVVLVDDGRVAAGLIARNIALLDCGDRARLIRQDATRLAANDGALFDLVFLDPPYGKGLGQAALMRIADGGWLAEGALIVLEDHTTQMPPPGFDRLDARRYGDTHVTLMQYGSPGT